MPKSDSLPMPDTYTFILAAVAGIAVGGILSVLFSRLEIKGRLPWTYNIAGYPIGVVMTNILIIGLLAALVFLGYVSIVVRDTTFPSEHPWLFFGETLFVGFVPATVIYIMNDARDTGTINFTEINREFLLLAAKFATFHLLFQFSGTYSYFFHDT
jgi:hypothetical protein